MLEIESLPAPIGASAGLGAVMLLLRATLVVQMRTHENAEAWLRALADGMRRDAVMNGPAETPALVDQAVEQLVSTMLDSARTIADELPRDFLAKPPRPRG